MGMKHHIKHEKQSVSLGIEEFPALPSSNSQLPFQNVSNSYAKRDMAKIIRSLLHDQSIITKTTAVSKPKRPWGSYS
eukprot:TRINITY_DN5750_c0_g1_i1.p1 TRINITY_DN5750_c0_g1~~TRINITY_DN5750_c0_g1_i1.p1  ORF type:complete len:77 (+),score=5.96 TRINITY_DN5750_c0_g1_i1:107-337(+)